MLIPVESVRFVKELYPRVREDDAAIERYRAALDRLPPITVARGVLVDGFHRWQAHRREGATEIEVEDLGDLTEIEIIRESVKRNASHGRQLESSDKKRMADRLWRQGTRDVKDLADLLSLSERTVQDYTTGARSDEKDEQKAQAWDLWLDCLTHQAIADEIDVPKRTVTEWLGETPKGRDFAQAPESRQHFDVWSFATTDKTAGTGSYFGKMPPQIVENLLWLYTEPGQVVVDPFAGGGTTIDVAKRMGRRVWASDLTPSTPTLPIHEHDITTGWPKAAPRKADFVLLDPPYWQQAAGKYSDDPDDLANMDLDGFMAAWNKTVKVCADHLTDSGRLAYLISPTQLGTDDESRVVDHATEMIRACWDAGLTVERRIVATYSTQQATGQQVEWARENRRLLKLYRDVVVLGR